MSNAILDFADRVSPLRKTLEDAYLRSGKRTGKSIQSIPLHTLSWGPEQEEAFHSLQDSLRKSVMLSHPDPSKETCVFTDASDSHWAAVVTQCAPTELDKPIEEQRHLPLAFLSSAFKKAELGCSTFEKEAFAIVQVFKKLDYLLLTQRPVHVYTDHRNLLFVFNPLSLEPVLGRHIVSKVQRWALHLSKYSYTIEHIEGDKNVMADIMTRWFSGYRNKRAASRKVRHIVITSDMVPSTSDSSFIWPTVDEIRASQQNHIGNKPNMASGQRDGLWVYQGRTWIPEEDIALQLKLIVIAHSGRCGHRGAKATQDILKEAYTWKTMDTDVI